MSSLINTFKKQGGTMLLKQWWWQGNLLYVIRQLLLTGVSKKGLELLRNGVSMRTQQKLRKKYLRHLRTFDIECNQSKQSSIGINQKPKIWICWMQGIQQAPDLVKRCFSSIQANITDREIILITSENVEHYTHFPDYILQKYQRGVITHTHFSDLLRLELLAQWGGTWIDATVFCSGNNIDSFYLDSNLFVFQNLKPGADGATINLSSWFMTAKAQNRIILAVRHLLWIYWEHQNKLIDYFLLHHFFMMVASYYEEEWEQMIQLPNSTPHILQLMLFEPFNQEKWQAVCQSTPFHKLSYKFDKEKLQLQGTYYQHIMSTGHSA